MKGIRNNVFSVRTGKPPPTDLLAVRETGVYRHHGGPIEGTPVTPRTSQHYHIEGISTIYCGNLKGIGNNVFSARGPCSILCAIL